MGTRTEPQPVVTVRIVPGKAMPAQSQAWFRFFTHLLAECQHELKAESKAKFEANYKAFKPSPYQLTKQYIRGLRFLVGCLPINAKREKMTNANPMPPLRQAGSGE